MQESYNKEEYKLIRAKALQVLSASEVLSCNANQGKRA